MTCYLLIRIEFGCIEQKSYYSNLIQELASVF